MQEARLADARIASQEHGLTPPVFNLRQQILEQREFTGARHEGRRVVACVDEPHDPPRLPIRGRRNDRLDVESTFEERPCLVRCDDGLAGRACQQPVEQPLHGAPRVGIELNPIVHSPDEHLIGVERNPHWQLCV